MRKAQNRYCPLTAQNPVGYKGSMRLRLKELRKARGWTQKHVADLCAMSQSYYAEVENGTRQSNARLLESFAKAYGVEPRDLIFDEGNTEHAMLAIKIAGLSDEGKRLVIDLIDQLSPMKSPKKDRRSASEK